MVDFTVGVPGSGKTYKSVYTLFANFAKNKNIIKDKSFKLKNVNQAFTNINELKFESFDNVYRLDFDELKESLTILHTYYKAKKTDTELIEKAKELKIYDTLFIIDECHNYFDTYDTVLVWWLSYHRHLHHEIILITQNLALVHSKYKSFSEYFYKAHSNSTKLFSKSMKYSQYLSSRLSLNSKVNTITVPIKQEVFETYGSGKNVKSKSLVKKYFIAAIVLVLSAITFFKFFFGSSSTSEPKQETKVENRSITKPNENTISNSTELTNKIFIEITCFDNYCLIEDSKINYKYIKYLISSNVIEEISNDIFFDNTVKKSIIIDKNLLNSFKGVQNEKSNNQSTFTTKLF